jgi:hypothetical protein
VLSNPAINQAKRTENRQQATRVYKNQSQTTSNVWWVQRPKGTTQQTRI